jgi:lysophosphatidate acyltransferase
VVSASHECRSRTSFSPLILVLPPVSTTGLKAQDASDLAVHVRDLMIEALREISVKVPTGQTRRETKAEVRPSASKPQTDTPQLNEAKIPQHIPTIEEKENVGSSASLTMSSSTSSLHTWQSGTSEYGAETEEDEGMILVGRPA